MKKKLSILLTIALFALLINTESANAAIMPDVNLSTIINSEIEWLEDGCYIETIIEGEPDLTLECSTFATAKYITRTKTSYIKNSSGTVLWYVSIRATFSYDGTTAKCTSYTPSAAAPAQTWTIKSLSSNKYGSAASAVATATHKDPAIGKSQDITKTLTIKCSPTGVVS